MSAGAWLSFWWSNIGQVLLSVAPFILGGGAFGYLWTAPAGPADRPR
jgi:hypothetical protein